MKTLLMVLVILSTAGCSARAVYDNIQINNRQQCAKLPSSEYDECMDRASKSYDEYQQELQDYERERQEEARNAQGAVKQ